MSKDVITIPFDKVTIRLREYHDFGFLKHLGEVFCVFDEQDSGNICFGIDTGTEKLFIKYAGAKTIIYPGNPADAVSRLKKAMPVYHALRHPSLVELREHFPVDDGYAAVFTWSTGECLYMRSASTQDSPSYRHKHLPLELRLNSLDNIFAFHEYISSNGYVAIDFYDGCILYDFSHDTTKICDIDHYEKPPYINMMGRMCGSSRFMSPEEFELGATIDEVTNVFNMGATAFVLFGGAVDRSFEKWDASEALFEVARKAVNPDRSQRYSSISAFRHAWNEARETTTII